MRRFRLAPEAREDIKDICSFIVLDSTEAAGRVREEIRDSCFRLAQHPRICHRRHDLTTRAERDKMAILGKVADRDTLSRHDGVMAWPCITAVAESPVKKYAAPHRCAGTVELCNANSGIRYL